MKIKDMLDLTPQKLATCEYIEALEEVVKNVQQFVDLFPKMKGDYNISAFVENMLDTKIKPSLKQTKKVIKNNSKSKRKV